MQIYIKVAWCIRQDFGVAVNYSDILQGQADMLTVGVVCFSSVIYLNTNVLMLHNCALIIIIMQMNS